MNGKSEHICQMQQLLRLRLWQWWAKRTEDVWEHQQDGADQWRWEECLASIRKLERLPEGAF